MDEPRTLSPAPTWHPCRGGLDELVDAVRPVVQRRAGWRETAELVASELEHHLPAPDILIPEQRTGDAAGHGSYVLHTEPNGTFSVVAIVSRPGQMTAIHDHVTWCVFGALRE
jgi:3-mercaptopropionate dioxygenase